MPKALNKADTMALAKDPRAFLAKKGNAIKLAGLDAASKSQLATNIAKVNNVSKAEVLNRLDKLAVVSVSAIDW